MYKLYIVTYIIVCIFYYLLNDKQKHVFYSINPFKYSLPQVINYKTEHLSHMDFPWVPIYS